MISIVRKRMLSVRFIRRERRRAWVVLGAGLVSLGAAFLLDKKYEMTSDLYPVNVCYNVVLAVERNARTLDYEETSKDFTFNAATTHPTEDREIYVLVVGETSRALNWSLYGYDRETNPKLSEVSGLTAFTNVLTQSNTTHKSVPMLMVCRFGREFRFHLSSERNYYRFQRSRFQDSFLLQSALQQLFYRLLWKKQPITVTSSRKIR